MKRGIQVAQPRRRGRRGFTLVELLVVVSIIALLIAILLPSLKKARDQSKDVVCKANLHGIGQAFVMYAEKYQGVWPAAVDSMGNQNRWPVPFIEGGIIHQKLNQYDSAGNLTQAGGASFFICPADAGPRAVPNWRPPPGHTVDRVEVGGSYAYSGEIHRDGDTLRLGNATTAPFFKKTDECRRPGEVLPVMDNFRPIEKVSDPGWRYYRDNFFIGYRTVTGDVLASNSTTDGVKIIGRRHTARTNALAIDTHVESFRPESITYDQVSWTRWTGGSAPPGGR